VKEETDMKKENKNTKSQVYLESVVYGFFRTLVGLPFEHPFDSIKSRMQSKLGERVRFRETSREIYRTYGIREGFYAGFIPNAARTLCKQLYRWPLMLILPEFYNTVYSESLRAHYPSIAKISTGLTIAAFDTFIICPFERLKVFLQTKKDHISLRTFFQENRNNLVRSLFRGLDSMFWRQIISWVSFLYADHKFKRIARNYQNVPDQEALSGSTLMVVSTLVGISNVFIVMPFDMTKTLHQQHSANFANKKLRETIKTVYREAGIKGFYYGWQPRLIQYIINSALTVTALETLEHKMKQTKIQTET